MGRNIWQDAHPVAAIQAVRAVVQENKSADEAFELYQSVGGGKSKRGKRKK